jgi:hypothetical protein
MTLVRLRDCTDDDIVRRCWSVIPVECLTTTPYTRRTAGESAEVDIAPSQFRGAAIENGFLERNVGLRF